MKEVPVLSRIYVLRNRSRILKNPLPFHRENFEKHGDSFIVDLGRKNTWVFTRNPESIKYILQKNHKNYHKSALQTKDLAKYIGHGLLTSNGEFWRVHRRMVQPAFHKKKLEGLMDIMYRTITQELDTITPNSQEDIFPLMGDLAFQVVAQSLFSADNIRKRMLRLKDITTLNQKMLVKEMRQPYLMWWYRLKGDIETHLNYSEEAKSILNEIVQERADSGEEKDDLLDMLLSARYEDGSSMSRNQLLDEVMILFTAGHETTANALSFTLSLLARHPEIQQQLYDEVKSVSFEDNPIFEQIGKLQFTQQCIEEAMRLYPPAYFMDRVSIEEDTVDDVRHKSGTVWLMSLYELHRHPKYWKNPDTFDPNRFRPDNKKEVSDYYFPFGAGPRMCVGNNFAMYEMMLTIAILIKKFELTAKKSEIEINPLITLKPKDTRLFFQLRNSLFEME